jgi:hypothetical protein
MTIDIHNRALLTSLTLSMWNGRKLDSTTTKEILTGKGADMDAGAFTKLLIPRKALDPVLRAHRQARANFYQYTLPWDNNGTGILAAGAFMDFSSVMRTDRTACETAHKQFVDTDYPEEVKRASKRQGKLYVAEDFPSVDDIRDKFGFKLFTYPIPTSATFKGILPDAAEEAELLKDFESTVVDRIDTAQKKLWEDLFETLKHFTETMRQDDKIFRNSTVKNLLEAVKLAPRLSLRTDTKLEGLCADIEKMLSGLSADVLRENKAIRANTAIQAHDALAKIEAGMKGVL